MRLSLEDGLRTSSAEFIQNIPTTTEGFKEVSEVSKHLHIDVATMLISFLQFFNSIKLNKIGSDPRHWKLKARSEIAGYFHQSLAKYIGKLGLGYALISSWEKLGFNNQQISVFDWGSQFLFQMETNRVKKLGDTTPTRFVSVGQVIIKANVDGYKEPLYLVQLDEKINKYQLIGGRSKTTDKDIVHTVKRELREELYKNSFLKEEKFQLVPLTVGRKHYEVSPTYGAYTEYTFSLYQLTFDNFDIKLGGGDCWVTLEELNGAKANDGLDIRLTFEPEKAIGKTFSDMPLSTPRIQPKFVQRTKHLEKESVKINEVEKLIKEGESKNVEFKSSSRWDMRQNKQNKDLEKVIVKTIAGFLNSEGGKLLIGVNDDGQILGLKQDIETLKKRDLDGYMQFIVALITHSMGVEYCSNVEISFEEIKDNVVCLLTVRESSTPVFVKNSDVKEFYVRRGNTTKLLDSEETYKYILSNKA